MSFKELISLFMTAITYGLEIGIEISDRFLEFDGNGFYFVDKEGLDERKNYLNPCLIIDYLFKRTATSAKSAMPLIDHIVEFLNVSNIENLPSYIEIINLINKIKSQSLNTRGPNMINLDYRRLKSLLSRILRDESVDFRSEVLNIADLSFEAIVGIDLTNPILVNKIKRMA